MILDDYKKLYLDRMQDDLAKIKKVEEEISLCDNEYKCDRLRCKKNDLLQRLCIHKGDYDSFREDFTEDIQYRINLLNNYTLQLNETILDDNPIVFHGVGNLGVIKKIIETGGLFTPDERGVSQSSFATQIDVTNKFNIRTSLQFADTGLNKFLPYGAIFAFMPKEHEVENVLSCKGGSEVFNGVEGINFVKEPNRLVAIITSPENIALIKLWCQSNGIDVNKVCDHYVFLERMQQKKR